MTNRLWGLLILLAAFWGASFLFYEIGLETLSFKILVLYRIGGAALFLWALALLQNWPIPKGKIWLGFIILGLLNNVIPFSLIAWGQQFIESGLSAILNATTAFFAAALAPIFFQDEHLTWNKATGILIGFAGIITAIGIDNLHQLDLYNLGQWAVVGASFSYALGGIFAKKAIQAPPKIIALGMLTMAALAMLAWVLATYQGERLIPDAKGGFAALYLAVISTGSAYLLFYYIMSKAGVSYIALVTLIIPVFAIVLGALILDEKLTANEYLGFLLVMLGLIVIDGRLFRKNQNTRSSTPS